MIPVWLVCILMAVCLLAGYAVGLSLRKEAGVFLTTLEFTERPEDSEAPPRHRAVRTFSSNNPDNVVHQTRARIGHPFRRPKE